MIFLLNLPKIKTLINHRADEEVKVDIEKILQAHQTRIELKITKGDKALSGFKTNLKDRQPYHFIKFTFKIYYNNY